MPYFVFGVRPFAQIEKLAEFASFKDASAHAKALRAAPVASPAATIKIMFADTQEQAEDLLCQVRDARPVIGDD
jgi:hypothetical protein